MAKQIPVVNTNLDTFPDWIARTNDIINTVNTEVITANSTYGNTTGNSFLRGIFSANTIAAANTLRGGNVTSSATLTITSNVAVSANTLTVGNVVVNTTAVAVGGIELITSHKKISTNINSTSATLVDRFTAANSSGAEYLLVIKNINNVDRQISKLIVVHDANGAFSTEYAVMHTNTTLGTFSSAIEGANCNLLFTPLVTNVYVKGIRTLIDV